MTPGEYLLQPDDLEINAGRATLVLLVKNSGDRPIQVGSHYHFFEVNPALEFDRSRARGFRLDIASGTAMRFEPGEEKEAPLVSLAGERIVFGHRGAINGRVDG